MNEFILEAIVKLLAIIAKADGLSEQEYRVIKRFLDERLHDEAVQKYLVLFESYTRKVNAGSEAIEALAIQINQELSLRQKTIVLLHLVELAVADHKLSTVEEHLIQLVCTSLRISEAA